MVWMGVALMPGQATKASPRLTCFIDHSHGKAKEATRGEQETGKGRVEFLTMGQVDRWIG